MAGAVEFVESAELGPGPGAEPEPSAEAEPEPGALPESAIE